jgi:hypothetical protein
MRSDSLFRLRALLLLGFCLLLMSGRSALAQSQTFTTNTTITATNTTYENYDITVAGCTVTIDGQHTFHSLTLQNGGVVTHDPPSSANFAGGLNLNITTNWLPGRVPAVATRPATTAVTVAPMEGSRTAAQTEVPAALPTTI